MVVFEKPKSLADVPLHYCPGCTHGIVHRLVAEALDELGIEGKAIGVLQTRFYAEGELRGKTGAELEALMHEM